MKNNLVVQQILIINEIDESGYQEVRNPLNKGALSYVKHNCSKEDIEYMLKNISLNDAYIHIINKNMNQAKFKASEKVITQIYEFINNNINIEKSKELILNTIRFDLIDCDNIIFINFDKCRSDIIWDDFHGDILNIIDIL